MDVQHTTDEAAIRQRIDTLVEAIRAADLDGVMRTYAPDIVSFDAGPPLGHRGAQAKSKNWVEVFTAFQRPIGYAIGDLTVTVDGDVAFAYSLNRISGTLGNGATTSAWVRWTACLRKRGGNWLIVHDHVSVPFDPATGRALLDLEP